MRITRRFARPLPGKILALLGIVVLGCGLPTTSLVFSPFRMSHAVQASSDTLRPFNITSPDFQDGGPLSTQQEFNQFCTGSNIAPQLDWTNVPAKTKSFTLLMSDYDAPIDGGFHHWIVYNIPGSERQLVGNNAFTEGTTSFGFTGYGGPCPPPTGEIHHYLFLLYATDIAQIGGPGLTFDDVIKAQRGHVLGATSIIGTFHLPE